jgi:MoaA/NifB/PqqE/SkfB family radical SAM enzyme
MSVTSMARSLAKAVPVTAPLLKSGYRASERWMTTAGGIWPGTIRANTEKITIAITAHCNFRCKGCNYGRDFMPGAQLPLNIYQELIEDAAAAKVPAVRLYGGEPLLHPDVVRMVEIANEEGVGCYMTTNALILDQKIDALHGAGLRKITMGYYGQGTKFDEYIQRPGRYERLIQSLDATRKAFGPDKLDLQFNFLLSRQTINPQAIEEMRQFAERYQAAVQIDVVHYSLPYFQDGPELDIQFRPEDAGDLRRSIDQLLTIKDRQPELLTASPMALVSLEDWAMKKEEMKVPCDARKLLWIGADGSVMLCYVTFPLGNLHEKRLRDILYTPKHHQAARDAFALNCPNCHCESAARIEKHGPSNRKYSAMAKARGAGLG